MYEYIKADVQTGRAKRQRGIRVHQQRQRYNYVDTRTNTGRDAERQGRRGDRDRQRRKGMHTVCVTTRGGVARTGDSTRTYPLSKD